MPTNFKVSDKTLLNSLGLDPDNDSVLVLDPSDTTEAATGTIKRSTPRDLNGSLTPTASVMSTGTGLQDHIDARIADDNRFDDIRVPRGRIQQTNPLVIERVQGVTVSGTGPNPNTVDDDSENNWDAASIDRSTRFEYSGPAETPAAVMAGARACGINNMMIDHRNGGVCLSVTRSGAFYSAHNHCDKTWFGSGSIGVEFDRVGDVLNSDHHFRGCVFDKCDIGVKTNGAQNLVYVFDGCCYWYSCPVGIDINGGGGAVYVHGAATNGGGTFMRTRGGGNGIPNVISGLRLDRTGGSQLPIIYDGSQAGAANCSASIDGVCVVKRSGDVLGDHFFFRVNANWQSYQTEVNIGTTNLRGFGPRNRVHAIGVYNDAGTRIGHIYEGVYTAIADETF